MTTTTDPRPPTIEQVVADALAATGLSQAQVAYRLGMSRQALSDRLRGRTRWTTTDLPVACQLAGVSVSAVYRTAGLA